MDPTLSVVLPVHNAESVLADQVAELLEVLSDMTPRFEVLIVDNGSTDQTEEIAHELSHHYPQLRVARHDRRLGTDAALQTGMQRVRGEVVMVHEENAAIRPSEIRYLWEKRFDEQWVTARAESAHRPLGPALLERLSRWGTQLRESAAENDNRIQTPRPEVIEPMIRPDSRTYSVRICRTAPRPAHLNRSSDASNASSSALPPDASQDRSP